MISIKRALDPSTRITRADSDNVWIEVVGRISVPEINKVARRLDVSVIDSVKMQVKASASLEIWRRQALLEMGGDL